MPQTWLLQDISKIKQTQATVQSRDAVHSKATKQTDSPGTFYLSRPNGFLNPQEEERFFTSFAKTYLKPRRSPSQQGFRCSPPNMNHTRPTSKDPSLLLLILSLPGSLWVAPTKMWPLLNLFFYSDAPSLLVFWVKAQCHSFQVIRSHALPLLKFPVALSSRIKSI